MMISFCLCHSSMLTDVFSIIEHKASALLSTECQKAYIEMLISLRIIFSATCKSSSFNARPAPPAYGSA